VNEQHGASPANWVVIPAAGRGTRFGAATPKQYFPLLQHSSISSVRSPTKPFSAQRCVLECTLACFVDHPLIAGVIVAVAADDVLWQTLAISRHPRVHTVQGGIERGDSVRNALDHLVKLGSADGNDWVLVHDAARPCLSRQALDGLLAALKDDPVGGILALPVSDTVKQACGERIDATLDRRTLWLAQTPQMFRVAMLQQSLTAALAAGAVITDEASAIEWAGHAPRLVTGEARNLKITHADDLALARYYLETRAETESAAGDAQ
jgi:2-C-methyl-D-erythritol 4-phosphate cytidylyltransferase